MKILVIGDSCIDKYIYGECIRLCPEAPVPIFTPLYEKTFDGMAGNVHNNVVACKKIFSDLECDLITNIKKPTKTRYVDNRTNQMIVRIDDEDKIQKCEDNLSDIVKLYDAIIISDYNKGYLTSELLYYIGINNKNTFIDTKRTIYDWSTFFQFIKINQFEYQESKDYIDEYLLDRTIITEGINGCHFNSKYYKVPTPIETIDTSGAGDTFLATFATHYTYNNDIDEAMMFAQECCGKVISKRGTATI